MFYFGPGLVVLGNRVEAGHEPPADRADRCLRQVHPERGAGTETPVLRVEAAEVSAAMRRGRARVVALAAFASAVAAVVVAGCAAPSSPVAGADLNSARSATIGAPDVGPTATGGLPALLQDIPAALVSADGRHITVTGRGGGSVVSISLAARETATAVKLSLLAVPARCPCHANLILEPVHATLSAPLGSRRLVDAATGQTITIMSGTTLATVGWLPAGFQTTPIDALADSGSTQPVSGSPGWVRRYAAQNPADTNIITISQYPGDHTSDLQPSNAALQPVDVNGHQAFSWHDGGADQGYGFQVVRRAVVWQQAGYTFEVEDSLTRVVPGQTVLAEADVLRVARSLTPPPQ